MPSRSRRTRLSFPCRAAPLLLVVAIGTALPLTGIAAPAWIQFLGWAPDGQQLAWRQGEPGSVNVPGQPCLVAQVDADGNLGEPAPLKDKVKETLAMLRIRPQAPLVAEQVTPADVLLKSARGHLFAVVVRKGHLAVLAKRGATYEPLTKRPMRNQAGPLEIAAFEDRAHKHLAIVAHRGAGRRREAHLLVLPLQDGTTPVQAPADPTPSAP